MKFSEAMKHLEEGKKVRCKLWSRRYEKEIYWQLGNDINLPSGCDWEDVMSEWELYDDSPKFSFPEVVKGLREGKRVRRKSWHSFIFVHQEMGLLRNEEGYTFQWDLEDFEAHDWEEIK